MKMKNIIISILLYFIVSNMSAQTIEVSGGINQNHFFDWEKEYVGFKADYTPGNGFSAALSLSELKFDSIPLKFSFLIDNYKGSFNKQLITNGGGYQSVVSIEKTSIGIGFYPMNITLLKKIELSIGAEVSYKIYGITKGYKSTWALNGQNSNVTFDDGSVQINKDFIWGLSGMLSYNLKLNSDWSIAPQYKFYLGMSDEFSNIEDGIKSFRHYFELSIFKRIK